MILKQNKSLYFKSKHRDYNNHWFKGYYYLRQIKKLNLINDFKFNTNNILISNQS